MALVVNDRVKETTTTTGTGTVNLAGAVSGFESFVAGIGNSNTTYYAIVNSNGEFEVGLGTVTDASPDTLARTTIISSSNSDSAVNFSAGTKNVFCTLPASKAVIKDANSAVTIGDMTLSGSTISDAADFTIDVAGDINLDAGGADINFIDDGTKFGHLKQASNNMEFKSEISDADIKFKGNDGGATITALSLDMSDAGTATFNHDIIIADAGKIGSASDTDAIAIASNGVLTINGAYTLPNADGSANQVLTTDGSGAVTFETPTTGDITGVTAGTNLTGGGTSGDVTINLADASTSAKGAASFSSDNFAASSGAITIKDSGVATAEIQDDAVTQAKIADDAVGADQLAANAVVTASIVDANVTTAKIADSNVTLAKMAANSVDSNQYVDGSIDTAHIANDQITNALMADNAIDTAQIADNAVSLAKMASGTDGNIISFDASGNPVAVATGSSGQVLTSAGAGAVPSFQTPTVGDITSVVAGSGLTGGATSGAATLNIGAGTGIDVAADAISVDVSDFMANGSNNRIITATGTDAQNAEANLTFDGSTLTVSGAITTTGNITTDHVLPTANDTFDLGADGNVWRNVYTGDLHLTNEAKSEGNSVDGTKGNWTIQEGEEHLFILNNKSGKKYKFKLEEI